MTVPRHQGLERAAHVRPAPPMAELALRGVACVMLGAAACLAVGWDAAALALIAFVYCLGEAGAHQSREDGWPPLRALANQPMADAAVFDLLFAVTIRESLTVAGLGLGFFAVVTLEQGHALPFALAVGLGCGLLLWAVTLATVVLLLAALPGVPLSAMSALVAVAAFVMYEAQPATWAKIALSSPAGWAIRIFEGVARGGTESWRLGGMCLVLCLLARLNLLVLRRRYVVPELAWRVVPAEQVFDVLVRAEAEELVEAGVKVQAVPSRGQDDEGVPPRLPADLRQRARLMLDRALRDGVLRGFWRNAPVPEGPIERLLWILLPAEHRDAAEFVAPMGRTVSRAFGGAMLVLALSLIAAWTGAPLWAQGFGFVTVACLCWLPGGPVLHPVIRGGRLPLDVVRLLWMGLQIAAMRLALWLPLLLVQAAAVGTLYSVPAVGLALRAVVLVLALQPFVVALRLGGQDAKVRELGWVGGPLMALVALAIVLSSLVGGVLIASAPPLAEAPAVALVAVLSLVVFVLHGVRLSTAEPS